MNETDPAWTEEHREIVDRLDGNGGIAGVGWVFRLRCPNAHVFSVYADQSLGGRTVHVECSICEHAFVLSITE